MNDTSDNAIRPSKTGNVYDDGELWSFIRRCMSQGKDIHLDHAERTYEEYSARLDLAALERLPELQAYIGRAVVAARGTPETSDVISEATAKHWLGELLAIIHRDGGQYEAKHGSILASQDAIKIVHVLRGDRNCKVCDGLGYSVGVAKRVPCDECEGTGLALLAEHATPAKAGEEQP